MQIPVLNGVYTDEASNVRMSYPHNLIPVPVASGISSGYLRPAEGITANGVGPGVTRGGINWNGTCYRVMGDFLVKVSRDGTVTSMGYVGGKLSGYVSMDYSNDYLSISSDGRMFLFDGNTVRQITDPDLGLSLDNIWVDGYFMSTDGEFIVVTELTDPFIVLNTKYASSEADPDPVVALIKVRNEPYVLNRYTIEVFDNIGGTGFPFQRIEGAQIQRGCVGTNACALYMESVAFVGGGRNEAISIWLGLNGQTRKLSTREIDRELARFTEEELADILVETRVGEGHNMLLVHLPDKTLVYDGAVSADVGANIWFTLGSGVSLNSNYRAVNIVRCYDKWLVGDSITGNIGYLDESIASHWSTKTIWEFGTIAIYNEGSGAIFHELELVGLTGRVALGDDPRVWTMYSTDGEHWSQKKYIKAGKRGERNKRLVWLQQGSMRNWRVQRFGGDSDAHMGVVRLEARLEPLYR